MIVSVTVLSYEAIWSGHGPSIIDTEENPIFDQDADRIISVRFHDLDPHSSTIVHRSSERRIGARRADTSDAVRQP